MAFRALSRPATWLAPAVLAVSVFSLPAAAADMAPEAMVEKIAGETLSAIKADPALQRGDVSKIIALVDGKIMPHVNFTRMMGAAVGPTWRTATPDQKQRLEKEFKTLLATTYAGAFKLAVNKDLKVMPLRGAAGNDVVVRSQLVDNRGGEAVPIDYRLEKTPGRGLGWRAYNLSISNLWTVDSYRKQFEPEIRAGGIEGLINKLAAQNKANAGK